MQRERTNSVESWWTHATRGICQLLGRRSTVAPSAPEDDRALNELEEDRTAILEMIARCEPLGSIMLRLTRSVRGMRDSAAAAVLLRHEGHWHCAASLGVPPELLGAARRIGVEVLAGRDSSVESLAESDRWEHCRSAAADAGLGCVWLTPIRRGSGGDGDDPDGGDELLGAILSFTPAEATPSNPERAALASRACLAAVAIDHNRLSHRVAYQTHHDPLTGLPNRVLLDDRLRQALAQSTRAGQQVAVFFIDIDGFKRINETMGHGYGDELLKGVAERLATAVRQGDTLARMGGDEFALVAPALADRHHAARLGQRLLDLLKAPFTLGGQEMFVSASIGIAVSPQDGNGSEELRQNADAAMYRAKNQGRNCFECFAPEFTASAREQLQLEMQLRRALDHGQLELHYQPQVTSAGDLVGFEGLLRWRHPELGMVPPGRFIPLAEASGLIVPLGSWVLREACRQVAVWNRGLGTAPGPAPVTVAVNISPAQFARSEFVPTVLAALSESGADPRHLEIEITESLLMRSTRDSAEKLQALREAGVGIAIDDFGTGYSSLAYLHQLPIDTLKIDRSFIMDLGEQDLKVERKTAVIRSITSLAHSLGLRVVAEGVETQLQRNYLHGLRCQVMQGFLFSKPLPVPQATERLAGPRVMTVPRPIAIPA